MPYLRQGIYEPVTVLSSRLYTAKTGNVALEITFSDGADGISVWRGWLSDRAMPNTEKVLKLLGWDPAENNYRVDLLNGTSVLADLWTLAPLAGGGAASPSPVPPPG